MISIRSRSAADAGIAGGQPRDLPADARKWLPHKAFFAAVHGNFSQGPVDHGKTSGPPMEGATGAFSTYHRIPAAQGARALHDTLTLPS